MSDFRLRVGPRAIALATELTGEISADGLEAGIRKLQDDKVLFDHLKTLYEAMATTHLMLLSLTAKEDSQISEAVERMSNRSTVLMQQTAKSSSIEGPKLGKLAERMRVEHQINERGIEQSEQAQERGGREQ